MEEKYRFVEAPQTIISNYTVYPGSVLTFNVLLRFKEIL